MGTIPQLLAQVIWKKSNFAMGLLELYPYLSRHSNYSPRTNKCQMFKKHLNTQQKLPGYMASQKRLWTLPWNIRERVFPHEHVQLHKKWKMAKKGFAVWCCSLLQKYDADDTELHWVQKKEWEYAWYALQFDGRNFWRYIFLCWFIWCLKCLLPWIWNLKWELNLIELNFLKFLIILMKWSFFI